MWEITQQNKITQYLINTFWGFVKSATTAEATQVDLIFAQIVSNQINQIYRVQQSERFSEVVKWPQ